LTDTNHIDTITRMSEKGNNESKEVGQPGSTPVTPEAFHEMYKSRMRGQNKAYNRLTREPEQAPAPLRSHFQAIKEERQHLRESSSIKTALETHQMLTPEIRFLWKDTPFFDLDERTMAGLRQMGINTKSYKAAPISQIEHFNEDLIRRRIHDIETTLDPEMEAEDIIQKVLAFRDAQRVIRSYGIDPLTDPRTAIAHLN